MIADREFESDAEFRTFRRHLFHSSLTAALETMCPAILPIIQSKPCWLVLFKDGVQSG